MISKYVIAAFLTTFATLKEVTGQTACTGVTCSNKGICVENNIYSQGYWCDCDEGWAGQDCKHPEPTVKCGHTDIEVVIDKDLVRDLEIDGDAKYVYFGRSSASRDCRAREEENLYRLSIKAPFTNCGTQVIQRNRGDDYTFSNTVVWNRDVHSPQDLIDRELVLLDFKCIYEDTYTVTGPAMLPTLNILQFASEKGQFEVRMRLYDDDSYSPSREYGNEPSVMIGTNVYVQIILEHMDDPHLSVTMDRCFASQSRDPADPIATKHMLITERCADKGDSTVQIQYNGEQREGRFRFQMFKWRWSADDVYLHCEIDICNKTLEMCSGEGENCKGDDIFRKKRSTTLQREGDYIPDMVVHSDRFVSRGPIIVKGKESMLEFNAETDEEAYDATLMFLGITVTMILAAVGVIIACFCKKRDSQKSKKFSYAKVPQQHLSSLRFTTEAF